MGHHDQPHEDGFFFTVTPIERPSFLSLNPLKNKERAFHFSEQLWTKYSPQSLLHLTWPFFAPCKLAWFYLTVHWNYPSEYLPSSLTIIIQIWLGFSLLLFHFSLPRSLPFNVCHFQVLLYLEHPSSAVLRNLNILLELRWYLFFFNPESLSDRALIACRWQLLPLSRPCMWTHPSISLNWIFFWPVAALSHGSEEEEFLLAPGLNATVAAELS